jgi:DNA-binding PucR family transcriptional regulator
VRLLDVPSQEMSVAGDFVIAELGGLASTDARARELRTTLLEFLVANRSYQAVARSSHLQKNTVVKRVARAEQLLGAPIADRQLEIHTALQLADIFGDRMLDPTVGR